MGTMRKKFMSAKLDTLGKFEDTLERRCVSQPNLKDQLEFVLKQVQNQIKDLDEFGRWRKAKNALLANAAAKPSSPGKKATKSKAARRRLLQRLLNSSCAQERSDTDS